MLTRRRRRFVHGQIAWMLTTIVLLAVVDAFSFELFFMVSLVGLLILVEITAPVNVTPKWRARLKWVVVGGVVVFAAIIVWWLVEAFPWEVI